MLLVFFLLDKFDFLARFYLKLQNGMPLGKRHR